MKKIKVYNINQYTKKGVLKKNSLPEMALTIGGESTEKEREHSNNYIATTLKKRGYHSFSSPYFFSHIDALNAQNDRVLICESVVVGSDQKELMTTPKALYELLTK